MNTDVWKKIKIATYYFIGIICFGYIIETLLYKFGFEQTGPKIYNILCYTILNLVLLGLIFKKNEIKKTDTYFILVLMVLEIGAQFFIHN